MTRGWPGCSTKAFIYPTKESQSDNKPLLHCAGQEGGAKIAIKK
jgi:hypothetical protein